jgi:hypothetical protein
MPAWYNPPTKDSKFATLAVTDWSNMHVRLDFEEFCIKEDDTFYYLFGFANEASDLVFVKAGRDWKFEPQMVTLKIAKKDYERWDMTEKKSVPASQSKTERFFAKIFSNLDLSKVYTGKFGFSHMPLMDAYVLEENDGQPMAENVKEITVKTSFPVTVVDEPQKIKINDITIPTKSKAEYAKGQTEYERLNDRLKFLETQLRLVYPDNEFNSLKDIVNFSDTKKADADFAEIYQIIVVLLGH